MHIQFRSEPLGQQVLAKPLPVDAVWRTAAANVPYDACVTCVIPCLNECENLRVLLPLLRSRLAALCTGWEIIVADDGSTDGTEALMAEWSQYDGFRYVQLSRNFGKEAALSAGLESATGDVVICLDADMQHPPALIEQMLARWAAGAEMVYAVREGRNDESWIKRTGARWFYKLLSGARGVDVPAHAGDFRLMSRNVVDALNALPERTRFMKGLYAWVGFKGEALPYTPDERMHGDSRFGGMRLARLALDGLTAFTTWPLRLVSLVGVLFAVVAMAYATFLVVDYLVSGNPVSGWTTIVTAVLFFAGVNLISLGVVGEYVARIFDEVKGRPLFVVRRRQGQAARNGKVPH
ncbi:MAG: glycosyltransferase family 2 protein [Achromobacter pulmonis]|uniref:Putative glycosyltransferase n=1 Tax=Achromobacter pulmonis TaxID=1389932 RepID=A0A6S7E969_9BURK|nr:glycosyltransferase family 2 protein [Achromobacter pulmonis]MCF7766923.1 glycosyltransferase family 2 protein [Achromobacter pulmonis]MPT27924.1 glycosyltransferase [Achromobacter sp.]CAB3901991.1 putative glycosyltransferase [Achromobacter pulmonis]